jgi:ribosomal protein S27AE
VLASVPPAPGLPDVAGMPRAFAAFMALWILLGIASAIFYRKASYQTKKTAHPYIVAGFGIIFLAFVEWFAHGDVPVFFVVAIIVISFLNIRLTRFCSRCGATIFQRGFSRFKFCPKCGAELQSSTFV